MAPAYWNIFWLTPWPCGSNTDPQKGAVFESGDVYYDGSPDYGRIWNEYEIITAQLNYPNQQPIPNYYSTKTALVLNCFVPPPWLLPASSRFAILGNLPNSLTLTSRAPLITRYGMPLLYVYDKAGNLVATETSTTVSSGRQPGDVPVPFDAAAKRIFAGVG